MLQGRGKSHDDAVNAALTPNAPASHNSDIRAIQAVAAAIQPSVHPTEAFRAKVKDEMLRAFALPRVEATPDAGSRDGADLVMPVAAQIASGGGTITLTDVEGVDGARAVEAADRVREILAAHAGVRRS